MAQHLLLTLVLPPLLIAGTPGWLLQPLLRPRAVRAVARVLTHPVVAATIFWWPVMSPVPELPRLPYGMGMLYLFLVGIPMQIVAALITLADGVLYPWYAAAPRTWGLSPLEDQQFGGLLMWVPGNLWMFLAIGVLFLKWARETE
jgi:putative membrane protein